MFKVQVVKDMRCHIESGHNFMLAKKIKEKQQQQTILACNPRESFPDKTNNFPHVLMSGEIAIATKCVGRYAKKTKKQTKQNKTKQKSLFTLIPYPNHYIIHAVPYFMVGIICGSGFAVQFWDHLRSGIISGSGIIYGAVQIPGTEVVFVNCGKQLEVNEEIQTGQRSHWKVFRRNL